MADSLKVLDVLGDEIERVAYADERAARRAHGGRSRRRAGTLAAAFAVALSGVALAASGLLTGEPVDNPGWVKPDPRQGVGVPIERTAQLAALRAADPDGGPPWGIRVFRTTRGFGCVQVGRVVEGELGVLGQDGAFGDDGKFHPLPTREMAQAQCQRPDDADKVYLAMSVGGLPASGFQGGCVWRHSTSAGKGAPRCDPGRMRILFYGLLGPDARAVTYRESGGENVVKAPTAGRDGAYLVVVRPDRRRPARGGYVPMTSPGSGLTSVLYRTAPTCTIRSPQSLGGAKSCPRVGYYEKPLPKLTTKDVTTPIRVRRSREWIEIAFRARVAASARRVYAFGLRMPHGCPTFGSSGPAERDVREGEVVTLRTGFPSGCHGRASGVVAFMKAGDEAMPPTVMPGFPVRGGVVVGRFTLRLP